MEDKEFLGQDNAPQVELPRWKSHKEVHAFKITKIIFDADIAEEDGNRETDGSATLYHDEGYFMPIKVGAEYVHKHKPQAGGYFVQYKDGYKSWSPAEAFEEGYTKL